MGSQSYTKWTAITSLGSNTTLFNRMENTRKKIGVSLAVVL